MAAPLLTTKLHIPPLRHNVVPRPHLVARLRQALPLGHRLILISAPAGYGKTTLLAEWIHSGRDAGATPLRVGWVSLDEGDSDPSRFVAYLVAALQRAEPSIGAGPEATSLLPQRGPATELLAGLINQVAAVDDPLVLVLDDYHLIGAQAVHDALTYLVEHGPENLHLVIATRADPPLPLARLRGRGQLTELRQADLRFTAEEATDLLNRVMALGLSAADVAALVSRTEGWAASLQMAAASLQGRENPAALVRAFAGSHRYILDYLLEEVLQRTPDDVRAFLLQTAILDRLCGPLCDALLAPASDALSPTRPEPERAAGDWPEAGCSQAMLERLDRANLFVVPLDDERRWYRYHRLFAECLRARLRETQPERVPHLYRRAASWCKGHGFAAEAVGYALAAADHALAARLVEEAAEGLLKRSELATFLSWMAAIPDEVVRAHPRLCIYHAMALPLSGRPLREAEARLLQAMEGDTDGSLSAEVAAYHTLIAAYRGDASQAAECASQALDRPAAQGAFLRSSLVGYLGLAHVHHGDDQIGEPALHEAIRLGREAGNLTIVVLGLVHLAELCLMRGQLHGAQACYEEALESATSRQGHRWPIAGMALMGLGGLYREWNDLQTAARHVEEGIELVRQWGEAATIQGHLALARTMQAWGDPEGAWEEIRTARELAARFDATQVDDLLVDLLQVWLAVSTGDMEAGQGWIAGRLPAMQGASPDDSGGWRTWLFERLIAAGVLTRLGHAEQSLSLLEPLQSGAAQRGWNGIIIYLQIQKALALQATGRKERALAALQQALSLGEPEGYVRAFVDEGPALARLLHEAAARGVTPLYIGRLLAAFPATQVPTPARKAPADMVEPLSERELEVLRLVAQGLTNQEIAQRLCLTVRTIKWHASNIYSKLSTQNRAQAVAKARALGLLPPV